MNFERLLQNRRIFCPILCKCHKEYIKVKDVSPKLPTKSWQEVRNQVAPTNIRPLNWKLIPKRLHHFISAMNFSYSASAPKVAFSEAAETGGGGGGFGAQGTLLMPCEWSVVGTGAGGGGGTAL